MARRCDECGGTYDAPDGPLLRYLSDGPAGRVWNVAVGSDVVHRCPLDRELSVRHPTVHGRWLRTRAVLRDALDAARSVAGTPMGSAQLVVGSRLHLVASEGFDRRVLPYIAVVGTQHDSVCRAAFASGRTVTVSDVAGSGFYTPASRAAVRHLGIRAVLSAPVVAERGTPLAMLAVHMPAPYEWPDRVVEAVDAIARRAADHVQSAGA